MDGRQQLLIMEREQLTKTLQRVCTNKEDFTFLESLPIHLLRSVVVLVGDRGFSEITSLVDDKDEDAPPPQGPCYILDHIIAYVCKNPKEPKHPVTKKPISFLDLSNIMVVYVGWMQRRFPTVTRTYIDACIKAFREVVRQMMLAMGPDVHPVNKADEVEYDLEDTIWGKAVRGVLFNAFAVDEASRLIENQNKPSVMTVDPPAGCSIM